MNIDYTLGLIPAPMATLSHQHKGHKLHVSMKGLMVMLRKELR